MSDDAMVEDELAEEARLHGFNIMAPRASGLFECRRCAALCSRDGMSLHDLWHERVDDRLYSFELRLEEGSI